MNILARNARSEQLKKNLLLSSVPFFGLFTKTAAGSDIKLREKISTDIHVSS